MEQQGAVAGAEAAGGAGREYTRRLTAWGWLAATLMLLLTMVAPAMAAPFDAMFQTKPAGVSEEIAYERGVPAFDITLGGQLFTFEASGAAFSWQQGGIYVVNDTPTWTIRRKDSSPFVLDALYFDGFYGPSDTVTVTPRRNGSSAGATRAVQAHQPAILSFGAIEVDEIVFAGPMQSGLGLTRFIGDSMPSVVPTVTAVSPSSGPTAGGSTVIITGSGFSNASAVRFEQTAARSFNINSDTQITATTPALAEGVASVTVITPAGTSATSASSAYTFVARPIAPNISFSSATYNTGGNEQVSFNIASHMNGGQATSFALSSAANTNGAIVSLGNDGTVRYTPPLYFRGTDTFTYTASNAGGTSNVANLSVVVRDPELRAALVGAGQQGRALANVAITVSGGRAPYTCNTTPASGQLPAGVQLNADCTITGTPTQDGSFPFTATVTDSSTGPHTAASNSLSLQIAPAAVVPTVTGVSPSKGPTNGGTTVNITGTGFTAGATVRFGAASAISTAFLSSTLIQATAPAGSAGTVDITVSTAGGTSPTSAADQYSYVSAPTVTGVSPTSGPATGGTAVTVVGTGFIGTTAVTFGSSAAIGYAVLSDTMMSVVSPAGNGTVDIRVTTAGGTSAPSAADQFTYVPSPIITGLSSNAGSTAGGNSVVIIGTNLAGAAGVTFGATPAVFAINSNTQITATTPAHAAGPVNVTVATSGGASQASPASGYMYVAPPVAGTILSFGPYSSSPGSSWAIDLAGATTNAPTAFAVASATTSLGGSVSVTTAGQATYSPPVGVRSQQDSFQYTASNQGGTSNSATVTVYIGDPTLLYSLGGSAQANVALSGVAIAVTGGQAPYTCATALASGTLPVGVQLNPDCSLTGTATQGGTFTFTATVTDSSNAPFTATSNTLTLPVVASAPGAPTIGSAVVTGTGAVTVSFIAPASDGGSAVGAYTVTASPGGASATGLGSPLIVTGLTAGTGYSFSVTATNAVGTSAPSGASNTATPIAALQADPVSATVAYNATATPIALAITGTPSVVSVVAPATHGTAVASGTTIQYTPTPGYAGPDSFTYRASDAFSISPAVTVSITVGIPTITLSPLTVAEGTTSAAYSQTLLATGGAAPYTFAVTAGALPAGITLQSDGTLSGRATAAGTFNFAVTATDSSTGLRQYSTSEAFSLVIAAPDVVLTTAELPDAAGAQGYLQKLSASGGTAPYRFALRSGALPPGLTLSETGDVAGEPTAAGSFTFAVDVTDANGFSGNRDYTFDVQSAAQAITAFAASTDAPVYSPGATLSVSAAGGASGQPVLFSSGSPAVCSVQGSTVTVLGAGTCVLTASQNGNGLYAAAAQARLELVIASATPVITWVNDLSKVYGEADFELAQPQSNSPGTFSYTSSNTAVATVSGRTVTLQGEGTTTLTAIQAAGGGFAAARVEVQLVVAARPDPASDQNVVSTLQAQVDSTVRFAQAQQANIRDRLRQVRSGSNASSLNLVVAYAGNGSQGLSVPVGQGWGEAPALPQGWGAWAAGTLSFGSSGRGRTSQDFNTGGITVGADRAIGENVLLGLAGSWGRQDTEFDSNPSKTNADQRSLSVYGLWRTGEHLFVDAMLASGRLDFTLDRYSEAAAATAHGTREGDQWFGSVTFGYEHRTSGGATLTTYGRYDGHKAELDAYREQGLGVYDLSYGRQDVENSTLAVGLEGTHAFNTDRVSWRPYWSLEYRTALDDRSDVSMNYVQRPASRDYLLAMHSYNDDTLSIGAGVDLQFDNGWLLSMLIGHDQGRNTLRSNSIGLKVQYGGKPSGAAVRSRPSGSDRLGSVDDLKVCRPLEEGCGQEALPSVTMAR